MLFYCTNRGSVKTSSNNDFKCQYLLFILTNRESKKYEYRCNKKKVMTRNLNIYCSYYLQKIKTSFCRTVNSILV